MLRLRSSRTLNREYQQFTPELLRAVMSERRSIVESRLQDSVKMKQESFALVSSMRQGSFAASYLLGKAELGT
jgi:hypothetical protein